MRYRVLVAFDKHELGGAISGASLTPELERAAVERGWLEPIRKAKRAPRNKSRAAPANKSR